MAASTSSIKWIVHLTVWLAILFFIGYIFLEIAPSLDPEHARTYETISPVLMTMGREAWNFVRPFLQLVLILIILDWMLGKWGISWQSTLRGITWNVQTIIALL